MQKKKIKAGAGVLAGAQYNISSELSLNWSAECNYLGKFDFANTNVYQDGANIGLRYDF